MPKPALLRRLGNKRKIAHKIWPHFPQHTTYIELFFGAGGMYFNKPRAKYNFCNDLDDDVFNFWQVVQDRKEDLLQYCQTLIHHESLFKYWKENQESDPIRKAARFFYLSNLGYLGKIDNMHLLNGGRQFTNFSNALNNANLNKTVFANFDFRKFLQNIVIHGPEKNNPNRNDRKTCFIYADPPYYKKTSNYKAGDWTLQDTDDLFRICQESGIKTAISEFDTKEVREIAAKYGYTEIEIGERNNLKNRAVEMLYINYESNVLQLF